MTRRLRLAAVTVALFAMMAHALVPDGWMPGGNSGTGSAVIIPCDGIHHHGMGMHGPARPKDDSHRHDVCPFAATPPLAQPANLPNLIPRTLTFAAIQQLPDLPRVTANARVSPQSARAPPQLV